MKFATRTNWELRPNDFFTALQSHKIAGKTLLDLTASNPPDAGLEYDLGTILPAFQNPNCLKYHPDAKGLLSARNAVAEYYDEVANRTNEARSDGRVDPQQLVLTTSTSEAYTYAFRLLCNPGDEVLIPSPSYPLFEYLAGIQDVKLRPYSLFYDHGWQIDFQGLRQAIGNRTRAVMLVNPNNPTGSYVSMAERDELNAICSHYGLALIVDEVFLDYAIGEPKPSFAFNTETLTFTLSGISKICGLPQMKVAWLATSGPAALLSSALSRLEVIADTYLSMSAPVQLATPALLRQRETINRQLSQRVRRNLAELDRQVGSSSVSRLVVEGGWYAVIRVPRVRTDEELAIALLEQKNVLVQPGYFYDFPGEGYTIVSLITPEDTFKEGITRMVDYIQNADAR